MSDLNEGLTRQRDALLNGPKGVLQRLGSVNKYLGTIADFGMAVSEVRNTRLHILSFSNLKIGRTNCEGCYRICAKNNSGMLRSINTLVG